MYIISFTTILSLSSTAVVLYSNIVGLQVAYQFIWRLCGSCKNVFTLTCNACPFKNPLQS